MFDPANASLDRAVDSVAAYLLEYRAGNSGGDEPFVQHLVRSYVKRAMNAPHGAGAVNMALATYRIVVQQMMIQELTEAVEMREAGLQLIWAISDHAEEERKRNGD